MKWKAVLVLGMVVLSVALRRAEAQSNGVQFIGASRASGEDVSALVGVLNATTGSVEVSSLPFEFAPGKPFDRLTELVQAVLPVKKGRLRITVFGKWFPHQDKDGPKADNDFWDAWTSAKPDKKQKAIRRDFMSRVEQFDAWVSRTRKWAADNGVQGKLKITFCPVLEDTCEVAQKDGYVRLIDAIKRVHTDQRTDFRRCCLPRNAFRIPEGVTLELHGPWDEVKGRLERGDSYSNDGLDMSAKDFLPIQRAAHANGINVLYWHSDYNGEPFHHYNQARRTVSPFTGPHGGKRLSALKRVL